MSFSEEGFVAAAVASWLGLDKRLPASASHGMLSYDAGELHDSRRAEMVARVIRKGKRIAVIYNPNAGRRYGSWGRSGACVASMLLTAWQCLNTDKGHVFIQCSNLGGDPAAIVARLARQNDYAGALALAPFAGVKKRDIPLPVTEDVGGRVSWRTENVKRQVESAADYLVPELAKARRKREREERIERERERAERRRIHLRCMSFRSAYDDALSRLYALGSGSWSVNTLLSECGISPDMRQRIEAGEAVFKLTYPGGVPCSGGDASATWPLPVDGQPGDWTPISPDPHACSRGWHLATKVGIADWIKSGTQELWFAIGDEDMPYSVSNRKIAYSRARLVKLLAVGDLNALGKPVVDADAIARAEAEVEKARGEYLLASQGY